MPELPEVETVVNELNTELINETIVRIEPLSSRGIKNELSDVTEFKIISVTRRGKYIVFNGEDVSIIAHLRMTGKFVFTPSDKDMKYIRCIFHFNSLRKMYFVDVRKFGTIELTENISTFFSHLGPEPLTNEFTPLYFQSILKNRLKPIKNALLDQSLVAGIGNIYADESLFLSQINPLKKSSGLSLNEMTKLVKNIKWVLSESIKNMGTTLSDYRNTKNTGGENQHYLNVYGLEGSNCKVCNSIILRIKLAGRSTHFCPNCQK